MDLMQRLNNYCERLSPDFWAEPLNAVTNGAFLIAAVLAILLWRRKTPADPAGISLIIVIAAIGIGSFLFHTVATRWAALADVLPIAVFIHLYLFFALRRFLGAPLWAALAIVAAFLAFTPFVGRAAAPLVGSSAGYVSALLAIFVVGTLFFRRNQALGRQVLVTGGVFLLSLTFRTLDQPLCSQIAFGTHFLWHILNAVVLYLLVRVLILQRAG